MSSLEGLGQRCGWMDYFDVVGVEFYLEGQSEPMRVVHAELRNHLNQPVLQGEVRKMKEEYPVLGELYCAFLPSKHPDGDENAVLRYWLRVEHKGDELYFPLRSENRLPACNPNLSGFHQAQWNSEYAQLKDRKGAPYVPLRVRIPSPKNRTERDGLTWEQAVKRANAQWDAARSASMTVPSGPPAAPGECLVLEKRSIGHAGVVMAQAGVATWQDTLRLRNRCNRPVAYRLDVLGPGMLGFAHDGIPRQGTMPPEVTWDLPLECRWAMAEGAVDEVSWTLRWSPASGTAGALDTTIYALLLGEGTTFQGDRGWGLPDAQRPAWMPAWYRLIGEDGETQVVAWGKARTGDGQLEGVWNLRRRGSVGSQERVVYSEEVSVLAGKPGPDAQLSVSMKGQWVEPYSQRMPWGWIFYAVPECEGIRVQDEGRSAQVKWQYEGGEMPRSVSIQPIGVRDVEVVSSSGKYVFQPSDQQYLVRWDASRAQHLGLTWEDMAGWMIRFAPDLRYTEPRKGAWVVDASGLSAQELELWKRRWAQVPGVVGLDRLMRLEGTECVWNGMLDVRFLPGQEELGRRSLMGMGFGCWGEWEEGGCLTFREGGCDVEEWGWIERLYRAPGIERVYPEWVFFPEGNE